MQDDFMNSQYLLYRTMDMQKQKLLTKCSAGN